MECCSENLECAGKKYLLNTVNYSNFYVLSSISNEEHRGRS